MRRILAITVGGEPDPIMTSVKQHAPDFVLFFVTTRPSGGSRRYLVEDTERGRSILKSLGLSSEGYEIITLPHFDDFDDCFRRIDAALGEYEGKASERIADYTGGTKTMTAAMVAAAILRGWTLSVVGGQRRDTVKVVKGTELARRVQSASARVALVSSAARALYVQQEFAGAATLLQELFSQEELPGEESSRLGGLCAFLRALSAWDRFAYAEALNLLRSAPSLWREGPGILDQIFYEKGLSYRAVEDLVGNALRRAHQGRYEDAVLRLYRAVELLGQLRLQERGLDPSDLDLDKLLAARLPEDLAKRLSQRKEKEGRAWVGLLDAYLVLATMDDPVGKLFSESWEKRIRDLLLIRNKLFLEHGLNPVDEETWQRAHDLALEFLSEAFQALGKAFAPVKFPAWEELGL
ncbi:MAG: TIGR02710 family CRISPR-associated CARF protein [Candidatus Bipolaricaulaceae bacterium]